MKTLLSILTLANLKPLEFRGIKYFRGTLKHFGLCAAITQMSPLANLICHWRLMLPCRAIVALTTLCALCLFTGCAYNASYTTETTAKDGTATRYTKARGFTLFDGQAQLAGFKNEVGGTNGSGTTVGSLAAQSSTTTNFNDLAASIVGAAVKAAKTP